MFMVRIFFETLFGSSVQVKCVLDEILLNKSVFEIFRMTSSRYRDFA